MKEDEMDPELWKWTSDGFSVYDWVKLDDTQHMITVVADALERELRVYVDGEAVPLATLLRPIIAKRETRAKTQDGDFADHLGRLEATLTQLQYRVEKMSDDG